MVLYKFQQRKFLSDISTIEINTINYEIRRFYSKNIFSFCMCYSRNKHIVSKTNQRSFLVLQVHEEFIHFRVFLTYYIL